MSNQSTYLSLISVAFLGFNNLNLVVVQENQAVNNSNLNNHIIFNNNSDTLVVELPDNPYQIGDYYNARSYFKCSVGNTSHNQECPGGIVRRGNGDTSVVVLFPNNYEIQYDFKNDNVTTTYNGHLSWGKSGDEWYIGIDNELFIIIPDAAVYGG